MTEYPCVQNCRPSQNKICCCCQAAPAKACCHLNAVIEVRLCRDCEDWLRVSLMMRMVERERGKSRQKRPN